MLLIRFRIVARLHALHPVDFVTAEVGKCREDGHGYQEPEKSAFHDNSLTLSANSTKSLHP